MSNIPEYQPDEPTFPCNICGRKFIKSSLEKHTTACKKLASLHRKPFDSGKQRATGSDLIYADVKKAAKEKQKILHQNGGVFPRPKTNWKERHDTFIDAVSSSKKVDYALKTGAPLPPPPRTAVPSDYVQCEYCGRNFNEKAAERHIPFCKQQHTRKDVTKPATSKTSTSLRGLQSSGRTTTAHRDSSGERTSLSRHNRADAHVDRRRSSESRAQRDTATRNSSQSAGNRAPLPPTSSLSKIITMSGKHRADIEGVAYDNSEYQEMIFLIQEKFISSSQPSNRGTSTEDTCTRLSSSQQNEATKLTMLFRHLSTFRAPPKTSSKESRDAKTPKPTTSNRNRRSSHMQTSNSRYF